MNPTKQKRWSTVSVVLVAMFAWLVALPAFGQGALDPQAKLKGELAEARLALINAQTVSNAKRESLETEQDLKAKVKALADDKTGDPEKKLANAVTAAKAVIDSNEELKGLEKTVAEKDKAVKEKEDALKKAEDAEKERLKSENEKIYQGTLALLTMFLVLAIVLENALEVIFKWRVFQARFSSRGIKAPIMVLAAGAMVATFKLDILANLVALYKSRGFEVPPEVKSNFFTGLISAFTLAGGSAGVNRLMIALGVRKESVPVPVAKPPDDKAWVAIKLNRVFALGDLLVTLEKKPPPAPVADGAAGAPGTPPVPPQLVGTIHAENQSAREIILRNKDRFPQNGGWVVEVDVPYEITVIGNLGNGNQKIEKLGPYRFAPGAIVDFEVTI